MESTTYSSYKKLTGANKASQLADWLKSIDFDALMLGPTLGKHGYLGFMEHLSDEEAKKRFPKIKRQVPPEEPIYKASPGQGTEYRWNIEQMQKKFDAYIQAAATAKKNIIGSLDEDDIKALKNKGGETGLIDLSIKDIRDMIISKYKSLSASEERNLMNIIESDLIMSKTFADNFTIMETANNALLSTHELMGLNSRQMYQQAHKKVLNNARTEGIAERFVLEKDFDSRIVTFEAFREYALKQYDNMVKPEGSAALAFLNDPDYDISFAGILTEKSNDKKELKEKKEFAGKKATSYCFLHGYCGHGRNANTKCWKMFKDGKVLPGYSMKHVECKEPAGPIDGLEPNLNVANHFYK